MKVPRSRRRLLLPAIAGAAVIGSLTGCFGDPPPDPATAPLEIVLDGCVLNRDEVASGSHEVSVIRREGNGPGHVVVTDESGTEVFAEESQGSGTFITSEQTYTFTCTVGDLVTSSIMESAP